MDTDDPYAVLGVSRDASQREIRDAYRALARDLHPDKAPAVDRERASQQMARVNAAWARVSSTHKRREFDSEGASRRPERETYHPHVEPRSMSSGPARFPWRAAVFFIVVGIVAVLVLNAFASPPTPTQPDQLLQPGSCVTIDETDAAGETRCDQPHDGVVRVLIGFDLVCPSDTEPHRDRQGMGTACVDRALRTR